MQKLINLGFAGAITLALGFVLFGLSGAHADEKAMVALRATTVHISVGTGSIVQGKSGAHYILTNWHVCLNSRWNGKLVAHYQDGYTVTGTVVKEDPSIDLCAARITEDREALKIAPKLLPKQAINTRGYPGHILSESRGITGKSVTWDLDMAIEDVGECPKVARTLRGYDGVIKGCSLSFVSTLSTLYGRPGSSGSPVVDDDGRLVGVISSWHPGQDYEAGMVPFRDVRAFLNQL